MLSLRYLIKHYAIKSGSGGMAPPFLTSALDGGEVRDFPPLHVIQTGSGAQLASYPKDIAGSFSAGKVAGPEAWPFVNN
jgi:hypothetical protein